MRNNTLDIDSGDSTHSIVDHVLRYELYRHKDISERLRSFLNLETDPDSFNRSTWDILYFLMQSHLEHTIPSVTDIYLATGLSKGTAISGLAELERRQAVKKVRDGTDGRRRLIAISDDVAQLLEEFVAESGERLTESYNPRVQDNGEQLSTDPVSSEPLINLLHQLSHELRTPLTAILGFSEMIADESLGPVQPTGYAEYARDIQRAASHLLNSLNERVDTTLAEHGVSIALGPQMSIDLDELVDRACRDVIKAADRRGVILRRKWGSADGNITGDRDRLSQAIRKIIEAVVVSADNGNTVDVETVADGEKDLAVRIISPEIPTRHKRAHSQGPIGSPDNETFAKTAALVSAISAAHGGSFAMQSDGPRRHIVSITLPRS